MTQRSETNEKFFKALNNHRKREKVAKAKYMAEPYNSGTRRLRLTANGHDPRLTKVDEKPKKEVGKATKKVLEKVKYTMIDGIRREVVGEKLHNVPKTSPKVIRRKRSDIA